MPISKPRILPQGFYESDDVVSISRNLLGKVLCTLVDGEVTKGIIVETEAYRTPDDMACHASKSGLTPRTKTMYSAPGVAYVYICYGIHRMMNVITSKEGDAHAILIRAVEPLDGVDVMASRRGHKTIKKESTNGPGKLAKAMAVRMEHDATKLYLRSSPIYIEDHGISIKSSNIISGPRVGMSIHTGKDAHRPWRFTIKNNKWVSNPKVVKYPSEWLEL